MISSIKFTSEVITPAAAVSPEILTTGNNTDFGKSQLCSGAPQAEFLREGIFRCRAGVGGQGSRAAMESP